MKKQKPHPTFITKKYLGEQSTEELDFMLYDDILGKNWDDRYPEREIIEITKPGITWAGDSHPVKIETLEKMLAKAKKAGANYVEIMYHTDHTEYVVNAVEIRMSSGPEMFQHVEEKNRRAEKQQRIAKLEAEIKEIKKTDA